MLKKLVYATVTTAVLSFGSGGAMADAYGPVPNDNGLDYIITRGAPITSTGSETDSPFPKDNSRD